MRLKALQEQRQKLAAEIKRQAKTLEEGDRKEFSAEEQAAWDAVNRDYDSTLAQIQIAERAAEVAGHDLRQERPNIRRGSTPNLESMSNDDCRVAALQAWAKKGYARISDRERYACERLGFEPDASFLEMPLLGTSDYRLLQEDYQNDHPHNSAVRLKRQKGEIGAYDMNIGTGSQGGYLVPPSTLIRNLEVNMLAFGGVRQVAETIRTSSGEPLLWPTADDTGNTGSQISEAASFGSVTSPSFAQVSWGAYKFSSLPIKVTAELLQDSAFDIPSLLGSMMGERLGRVTNTKFTTGSGSSTPTGIVVASSAGVTAASASAITANELIDLQHTIDPAYRAGFGWMMKDSTVKVLRKLVDSNGVYLWQAGLTLNRPDSLLGAPITINQDMAAIGASAKVILGGNFSKYKIRTVGSVRTYRLQELYRGTDEEGFVSFIREDGNLLSAGTAPIKYLVMASS